MYQIHILYIYLVLQLHALTSMELSTKVRYSTSNFLVLQFYNFKILYMAELVKNWINISDNCSNCWKLKNIYSGFYLTNLLILSVSYWNITLTNTSRQFRVHYWKFIKNPKMQCKSLDISKNAIKFITLEIYIYFIYMHWMNAMSFMCIHMFIKWEFQYSFYTNNIWAEKYIHNLSEK